MILFVVLAIIFLYTLYSSERKLPPNVPPPHFLATSETVNWQGLFEGLCESPAEIEFLKAVISSYQLVPKEGILRGGGLELQQQVRVGHYRVDFLANKRLVVEIDGAAYHSSPEAIDKDRIRDLFLRDNGYEVLRIPATTVFRTPGLAVKQVYKALSQLPTKGTRSAQLSARNIPKETNAIRTNVSSGAGNVLRDFGSAVVNASNELDRELAIDNAVKRALEIFHREVSLIDGALKLAELRVQKEEWLSEASEREAILYRESLDLLQKALEDKSSSSLERTESSVVLGRIPSIFLSPPAPHPDAETNTLIEQRYSCLLEDRLKYFKNIREKLIKDSRLCKHVEAFLGPYNKYWNMISPDVNGLDFLENIQLMRSKPTAMPT